MYIIVVPLCALRSILRMPSQNNVVFEAKRLLHTKNNLLNLTHPLYPRTDLISRFRIHLSKYICYYSSHTNYSCTSTHHSIPAIMASGSVFSGVLQTITSTKLQELSKQRNTFNRQYATPLSRIEVKQDPLQRLNIVVNGTKQCLGVKTTVPKTGDSRHRRMISNGKSNHQLETDLENLDRFLEQARFDPSVSNDVLKDWENKLLQCASIQATKFQYADLYGKLVTEWLSSQKLQL